MFRLSRETLQSCAVKSPRLGMPGDMSNLQVQMLSSGFSLHWANFLEQGAGLNRLGQVIIHSGVDANLTISMHRMGGKGDHGNVVPSRTLARPDGAATSQPFMTGPWMSMRTSRRGLAQGHPGPPRRLPRRFTRTWRSLPGSPTRRGSTAARLCYSNPSPSGAPEP